MWGRLGTIMTVVTLGLTANLANAQEVPPCNLRQFDPELVVSLNREYSPTEFRDFLRGFGYDITFGKILFDQESKKALREFQEGYKIPADGTANPQTQELAADLVTNMQGSLNLVLKLNPLLPRNQFYGPGTEIAIRKFQKQYNFPETGIATLPVRIKLDEEAKKILCTLNPPPVPREEIVPPAEPNGVRTDGKG